MSSQPETQNETGISRRDFLGKLAVGTLVGAGAMAFLGVMQLPMPKVLNEPPSLFKIGSATDFPLNTYQLIAEKNVFIFRVGNGVKAMSAICTHLGCIVTQSEKGFSCPCHGSYFDRMGGIVSGPAPKGLEWLKVGMAPDGQLTVNLDEKVDSAETFTV
ncbi:MAG: ubiquinol-cytochrome c reductase iron-sulfur subunit [bacterium]|nr:ubiquinol-cytochrome c reductase iron-sulfur subunit [bacterium]